MFLEALLLGVIRAALSVIRLISDWLTRRRRGAGERLRRVLAIKAEIAEHFPGILPPQTNGEAIIRELRRMDSYPDLDESLRGISPWFKVELKGTYYRGVEVFLSVQKVRVEDAVAPPAANIDNPEARNVFVVGRIPYSEIEGIDWEGDEYYGFTHIYCRFRGWSGRKGPYESIELYDINGRDLGGGRKYYERLEGVRWRPKRTTFVRRWRDRRVLKKALRKDSG